MKYNKIIILFFLLGSLAACKKLDSGLINPNAADPSSANVDLLLNSVQGSFTGVYGAASDIGATLTRQLALTSGRDYKTAFTPEALDGFWTNAYTGVVVNANALIPLALEQKKYIQAGMAQVLKAYIMGTMVDYFGDVPNAEAGLGVEGNLNPVADPGAEVYTTVFALLDSAIANFGKSGAVAGPANDLFYAGDTEKWVTAANTFKLKFLMQTRLVDQANVTTKVTELLTANDLIDDASEDFVFRYGTNNSAPDSRHPHYGANYNDASAANNSANDYLGNYFMWAIGYEKTGGVLSNLDPRRRYYFYRQTTNNAGVNSETSSCSIQPFPAHYPADMVFCLPGDGAAGYWGRDHGDASGTPPDGQLRTTYGVYPAGGEFDASQATSVSNTRGGKGAGIDPVWMSFYTAFLEAEAALTLGITEAGTPRDLLETGIRASIAKVLAFPATVNVVVPDSRIPSPEAIDLYVSTVLDSYDAATTDAERLNIIIKEYYLAAWGNGIEPYNNYRRTGSPNNLQPVLTTPNPGFFIRSLFYPSVYKNRNSKAPAQKNPGDEANKVFWDNNPDNFIK
jgi:hypothetical protein